MTDTPRLVVIMYHYVRDVEKSPFLRLKALPIDAFRRQIDGLGEFEIASLESALAFIAGDYHPSRDLYLLTFDDGFKEHLTDVMPLLIERGMQGLFFIPTACLDGRVASVHKSHFLMAALGFARYQAAFREWLALIAPHAISRAPSAVAEQTYRWDAPEVARFKYLLNFELPLQVRDEILDALFTEHIGDEADFARDLYLGWEEARQLQAAGMVIGGHGHNHIALPTQTVDVQSQDLGTCVHALRTNLLPQSVWPFSYPYGGYGVETARLVGDFDFACAFTTEPGPNDIGHDPFDCAGSTPMMSPPCPLPA